MLKRFALLIEASSVFGQDPLPGAVRDVYAQRDWLLSKPGGLWRDEEIKVLNTPTGIGVYKAIFEAGEVDYAYVAFSGHGSHSVELNQTQICLQQDHNIEVRNLIPNTKRCTVVIDACRGLAREQVTESIHLSTRVAVKFGEAITKDYRREFDRRILEAEQGAIFLYSCGVNEFAGETERGDVLLDLS